MPFVCLLAHEATILTTRISYKDFLSIMMEFVKIRCWFFYIQCYMSTKFRIIIPRHVGVYWACSLSNRELRRADRLIEYLVWISIQIIYRFVRNSTGVSTFHHEALLLYQIHNFILILFSKTNNIAAIKPEIL